MHFDGVKNRIISGHNTISCPAGTGNAKTGHNGISVHYTIYKRLRAVFMAGVMALTLMAGATPVLDGIVPGRTGRSAGISGAPARVYATSSSEGTSEEASSEEDTMVDDSGNKVLKDSHGRIVLWKWEKVTESNANDLLNDGMFHPSMLVRLDTSGNPVGFVSTYADKQHIFRGTESNWYKQEFNVNGSLANSVGHIDCYNQPENYYIKLDDDGKSLNGKVNFGDSVLYSQGGTMGVPYIKATTMGNNLRTKLKGRNTYRIDTNIVLARGSEKNDNDVSFYGKMEGTFNNDDYYIEKYWRGSGSEKNEPFTAICRPSDSYWSDRYQFCFQPYAAENGGRGDTWVIKADLNEEDVSDLDGLDYAIADNRQNKGGSDIEGFSTTLVTCGGYLVAMDVRKAGGNGSKIDASSYGIYGEAYTKGRNIYEVSFSGAEARFMWYVGTPFTFASLVGQGGDEITGEGGVTTIGKGELLEVNNAEFMDINNNLQKSDGVILPEGASIVVNEGGVLSVTTNLINNGRIINNGGTIIIKEGGCISPFLSTNQGTMSCTNGGNVVVMPNGRLFCLSDAYMDMDAEYKTISNKDTCSMKLTGGSALINYGLFANSYCQLDKGSVIENRGDGIILAAVRRTTTNKLLFNAKLNRNGDFTTVDGLTYIDGHNLAVNTEGKYIMYYGITCPQNVNLSSGNAEMSGYDMTLGGTIRCDRTATLVRYAESPKAASSNKNPSFNQAEGVPVNMLPMQYVTIDSSILNLYTGQWIGQYDISTQACYFDSSDYMLIVKKEDLPSDFYVRSDGYVMYALVMQVGKYDDATDTVYIYQDYAIQYIKTQLGTGSGSSSGGSGSARKFYYDAVRLVDVVTPEY